MIWPMRRFLTGRLMAWIAIVAMLFNTLAPSVSHAVVAAQVAQATLGSGWTEVCTDRGTLWIQTAADGTVITESKTPPPASSEHAKQHFNDCAYCLPHAGSFGLLPLQHSTGAVLAQQSSALPVLYRNPLGHRAAWQRPALRAPPVSPAV